MELRKVSLERYKGYAEPIEIELAPLTILVGANNSGKTALVQAIPLLAGGLAPSDAGLSEPLPLTSRGISHGQTFEDLVTGRTVHGWLRLSATLADGRDELSFSATVRNVMPSSYLDTLSDVNTPLRTSRTLQSERQISHWRLVSDSREVALERQGFDRHSHYTILVDGTEQEPRQMKWRGLVPQQPSELADWLETKIDALKDWTPGVRHLRCPRSLLQTPLLRPDSSTLDLGPNGEKTPLVLAADDGLRKSVRRWYREAFGVSIDVAAQGSYFDVLVRAPGRDVNVQLAHSGRGLSHVLPVVVTALTARTAGPGVDIIEHPEAELHPAAHADVAELLLNNLVGSARPMIIETHSEMVLLRARRWIAEGRIPAEDVLVYWVDTELGHGSILRKIKIDTNGKMDSWPDGVFIENYEEILAIRRAHRSSE